MLACMLVDSQSSHDVVLCLVCYVLLILIFLLGAPPINVNPPTFRFGIPHTWLPMHASTIFAQCFRACSVQTRMQSLGYNRAHRARGSHPAQASFNTMFCNDHGPDCISHARAPSTTLCVCGQPILAPSSVLSRPRGNTALGRCTDLDPL